MNQSNPLATIDRTPFKVRDMGLFAGDARIEDFAVSFELTNEQKLDIEDAINERFKAYLADAEKAFGPVDGGRYSSLISAFVERVLKPCATKD